MIKALGKNKAAERDQDGRDKEETDMQRQTKTQYTSPDGEKVTRGRDLDTEKRIMSKSQRNTERRQTASMK